MNELNGVDSREKGMESILNWVGGKSLSAKKIVEIMPEHWCYIEPFFGAGWSFFKKPRCKSEVINDINGELINFWRTIQQRPKEFVDREKYEMYSRELFYEYYQDFYSGKHAKLESLERAFRFFVMIRCAFGSNFGAGFGFGCVRNCASAFHNEFEMVDKIAERLKGVQIDNRDFQFVIETYDCKKAVLLLDPPYCAAPVEKYYCKSMGAVEQFSMYDHQRLYQTLSKVKGKFILTIDDCPFIRERYCEGEQGSRGFWWIENVVFYSMSDANSRRHVTELIITNYDTELVVKEKKLKAEENKWNDRKSRSLADY